MLPGGNKRDVRGESAEKNGALTATWPALNLNPCQIKVSSTWKDHPTSTLQNSETKVTDRYVEQTEKTKGLVSVDGHIRPSDTPRKTKF